MLRRGQKRKNSDEYRHAAGCPNDDWPDDGSGDVGCDVNIGQQNEQGDDE
jgi:hypothetical protein